MGYRDNYFAEDRGNNGWYTCVRCGKKMRRGDTTIDHILPQHYGGGDNLQCMCRECNSRKGKRVNDTVPDYLQNNARRLKKKWDDFF